MVVTSIVVGLVLTVLTLVLTLVTISKGYSYKHTIDPLNKEDEVREFSGNGKRL
ncbi:MAG TPA: YtzI protein [Candidatus Pseudogracilibacillus intestinigallinarum]|uniref:YtzI protein n=1 Tax=Candidatus Pseudogracilibacillus intestinigallinarum TaxID=2838742 RepID=A0A9D1PLW1_9BACI|nr:YtzI protein [Candidatus Pseudogracilibacillus intestinigallinarum]